MFTGEIADGDGNTGDGNETEIIEGIEVSDDGGEWRVAIDDWVLWFCGCCDVCVHLWSFSMDRLGYETRLLELQPLRTRITVFVCACAVLVKVFFSLCDFLGLSLGLQVWDFILPSPKFDRAPPHEQCHYFMPLFNNSGFLRVP